MSHTERRHALTRWGILAAAVLAFLALGQARAHAALLDANCPGPADSYFVLTGNFREAQTFTVIHTGTITQAQTEIDKTNAGGNFQLQILATDGTGTPVNGALG